MEEIMFGQLRTRWLYFWHEQVLPLQKSDSKTIKSAQAVVLVPGFGASAGCLRPLKKYLEKQGYAVYTLGRRKQFKAPEQHARELIQLIQKIPQKDLAIVAHSMGGLIALAVLQDPKLRKRIRKFIATPRRGTVVILVIYLLGLLRGGRCVVVSRTRLIYQQISKKECIY
jgi:alpha-beta hydrolase superfamily lysophospholipase